MNVATPSLLLGLDTLLERLPPFGPQARAAGLALGAVLLWSTWPTLATVANPAPPFLIFGLPHEKPERLFQQFCPTPQDASMGFIERKRPAGCIQSPLEGESPADRRARGA